jgi:hypothetical protein
MYHYVTIEVVMRNCKSAEDAKQKCERLLPYKPDENCTYMESWEITRSASPFAVSPLPPKV